MSFSFKKTSADFHVYEELPFVLSGKGDAFYVYVEKRNLTTQEVIDYLRKKLKLSRLSLGIAGLKDKKAIARQWISIYDRALTQAGGERVFVDTLAEITKVIKTSRHAFPLNLSTPITNKFTITFRAQKNLWQAEKFQAQQVVTDLLATGYPNLFGVQRFGIGGRNSTQGWEILHGTSTEKKRMTPADVVFKLQAYASKIFNEYATQISESGKPLLDGDIVTRVGQGKFQYGIYETATNTVVMTETKGVNDKATFEVKASEKRIAYNAQTMLLTWPVLWWNVPLPSATSAAGQREAKFLQQYLKDKEMFEQFHTHKVFGLRRPLRVIPTKSDVRYEGDDLHISFTLPSWSYASIVFDKLNEALGVVE